MRYANFSLREEIMAYEKKLCILKQIGKGFTADGMPLMGAVYAERLGSDLTLTPRIAGLAPLREGRYALAAVVGRKEYCLELKGNTALRVPACPSLENGFAVGSRMPDFTFFLDLDPAVGRGRISSAHFDRLEKEKLSFHQRVYEGYLKVMEEGGGRFIRIDASKSVEEVRNEIYAHLDRIFFGERENG